MNSEKNKKIVRMLITVIIIIVIVWFLVVNPLVKFKKMENQLLNSAKRYFEVNQNYLGKYLYITVPNDIENSKSIEFIYTVRNNKYVYKIK